MADEAHRAGVVAILGPPNAGKSTLLNRWLGQKLAIVTHKPQTTRSRILGILTAENAQVLLLDTPGAHESPKALNVALNEQVEEAAADCDVGLVLADLSRGWGAEQDELAAKVRAGGGVPIAVGSQRDRAPADAAAWRGWPPPDLDAFAISAKTGEGLDALLAAVVERLPASPPLYPDADLSDRPLRFLAAELVREAAFEELAQELPYQMAVEVVEFEEGADLVRIRANLLVQRASQKQIVIGRGGEVIKRIGSRARRQIEELVGARVHLALWVKLEPRWWRKPKRLKTLGYS